MRSPVSATTGFRPEPRIFGPVTQTDVVRFAGAGGDFNPLHHDPAFAEAAGFPRPIAMGQLTAGLMAAWVTDWCGVEHLRRFEVRFTAPLSLGESVALSGEVTSVETNLATVALVAARPDGTVVLTGEALVRVSPAR